MSERLLVWVLFLIPEGLMMVIAGLGFLGVRRSFRRIALVGFMLGTAAMVFRLLLPKGYHILLLLLLYCILMVLVLRVSVKTSIVACFVSSFLINLGQVLVVSPIFKVMGVSFEQTLDNPWLHIAFGWLSDTLLLIATIFVSVRRRAIILVPESEQSESVEQV